jgi:hypothetical protein
MEESGTNRWILMNLELFRKKAWSSERSTIGEIYVNGVYECVTLELPNLFNKKENVPQKCCIPMGAYQVVVTMSNRFKREFPEILGVPERLGIRIHAGNEPSETSGCVLVGQERGRDRIIKSIAAFNPLFEKIKDAIARGEKVEIKISEE